MHYTPNYNKMPLKYIVNTMYTELIGITYDLLLLTVNECWQVD